MLGCNNDPGVIDPGCDTLLPSQCRLESACAVLDGWPVLDEGFGPCVDFNGERVGVGCAYGGLECLDVETYGAPSEEIGAGATCYLFPNSCLPPDWVPCEGSPYDEC